MKDDDIKRLSEDELAKHIDGLESQAWVQELRSLQPQTSPQDLYALGYTAAQSATLRSPASRWSSMTTAVLSSVLSAAATALLMWQLSPSLAGSSSPRELAVQPHHNIESVIEPRVAATTKSATMPQIRLATEATDLDDLLPGRMPTTASLMVPGTGGDFENGSGQIESERTRYVTQRQRWLSELSATMPD